MEKPININYYKIVLKPINTNKLCCKCDRIATYKIDDELNNELYCWVHSNYLFM